MLYRGILFPSRLFYNSICDPRLPAAAGGLGVQRNACSFIVTLLNLYVSIITSLSPLRLASAPSLLQSPPLAATSQTRLLFSLPFYSRFVPPCIHLSILASLPCCFSLTFILLKRFFLGCLIIGYTAGWWRWLLAVFRRHEAVGSC